MSELQNKVLFWRQERKLSAAALGALCKPKIHKQTILRIESGDMETTIRYLRILSKALKVPMRDLLPHEEEIDTAVPLVKSVPVIKLRDANKHPRGLRFRASITYDRIPVVAEGHTLLAGHIEGKEMAGALQEGVAVIWDVGNRRLVDGAYYVISFKGRSTWRRYRKTRGGDAFEDGDTPPIAVNKARVLGRVIGAHKTF